MSDNNEFTDVDDNTQPGKLRQLLAQAHARLQEKDKEIERLTTEKVESSVKSTWDELKVPDFVRGLYNGDKTPDAIKAWWENSKGFFNIPDGDGTDAGQQQEQESDEQRAHREAAERYQEAAGLGSNALAEGFDAATAKAKQAAKNLSGADLAAAKQEYYKTIGLTEY